MFRKLKSELFSSRYEDVLVTVLRYTIALIFVWFGALKLFGFNPVYDLVYNSALPVLASGTGLFVLGAVEVLIGILLFSNRWLLITHFIVLAHLLGTFSTFIYGWEIIFDPHFPVLTLSGEFVIKNMTLAISGLVVLVHESRKRRGLFARLTGK